MDDRDSLASEHLVKESVWGAQTRSRRRSAGFAGGSSLRTLRVVHGQIHGWQERFTITVGGMRGDDWVDQLRAARERAAEGIAQIHERWRNEYPFDFDRVYREELRAFGAGTLELHLNSIQEQARILAGDEPFDFEALMPSSATNLVLNIHHHLRQAGVTDADLWQRTAEFFRSEHLDQVPYLRISCLFAGLARKSRSAAAAKPRDIG
jgi:hypothetical protein